MNKVFINQSNICKHQMARLLLAHLQFILSFIKIYNCFFFSQCRGTWLNFCWHLYQIIIKGPECHLSFHFYTIVFFMHHSQFKWLNCGFSARAEHRAWSQQADPLMIIDTSTLSHIPSIENQRLVNLRKYCFPSTPSSNSDTPGVNTEVRPVEKGPAGLMLLQQTCSDTHCGADCEYTRFGACRKENNPHPPPLVLTSQAP